MSDQGRVVLLIPPGLPGTTPNREGAAGLGAVKQGEGGFRYPPQTVATVAAALRREGWRVWILDAVALGYDVARSLAEVEALSPDVLGVFVSWATREADARFLAVLRDRRLLCRTVAFGISVAWMEEALREVDWVLRGEPELAFGSLAERLLSGEELPRTVSPGELGIEGYGPEGLLEDLDALPLPAWDLVPLERYPYLSILSSRGC
ncbi:MAG: cobalamin-dependent protein, partial [Anaerolineae bacterium]|nr:cobalamin-dependent protein [Anaerolineae bacterium]